VEGDKKAAIILDCGIDRRGDAVWVDLVTVGFIVMLIPRIEDENGIRCGGPTKNNAIHGVGLGLQTQGVAVFVVMEVTHGKEGKPSTRIWACTMDKHEWGGEFVEIPPWYHVHHPCRMFYGIVPECARHLLLGEICA
jgi:hypothetical protein